MSLRIKKNDRVKVIAGKDKGVVSKVLAILPDKNRAIVEHVAMVKRHVKARSAQQPGGIQEREASIHLSNILLYCDKCKTGVRFGAQISDGKKSRVCKKCGGNL